jgi:hypothetical protein
MWVRALWTVATAARWWATETVVAGTVHQPYRSGVDGDLPAKDILRIARTHGAVTVRVFGSRARGDAKPQSDLDLLVGLEPGRSLLDVVAIRQDLEDLLGYSVDVVTEGGLSPYLRERVLSEAQALTA